MTSSEDSLTTSIVGAWSLISYVTKDLTDDTLAHPLGRDARGLILYLPDGWMSVQISAGGRSEYADGSLHGGTEGERAAAAAGYLAYTGRYEVDDDVVTHLPTASLFPNWEGARVPRRARIARDVLCLDLLENIRRDGHELTGTLAWRRVPVG